MKFIISKSAMEDAVKNICRVINNKPTLPILGDVLFRVKEKDETVELIGSDGEIYLTKTIIAVTVEGEGQFCVNATQLLDALTPLAKQPVTITATIESDNRFTLKHQTGETYFALENADEYPVLPDFSDEAQIIMPALELATGLTSCMSATDTSDLRPALCGVNINFMDDITDIVASDGHCLMRYRIQQNYGSTGSFVMPKKVAKILPHIMEWDDDDDVDVMWNETQGYVGQENWTMTFRFVEAKYPNYQSIIPENHPFTCEVERSLLQNCIRKVSPFSNESSNMIRVRFESNQLTALAEDVDFSAGATDKMDAVCNVTKALEIGLKASTVLNVLSKMPYNNITIRMADQNRAVLFEEAPKAGTTSKVLGNLLGLAMPMLLND